MKPRSLTIFLLVLTTMSFLACKKTEKGESKRWESSIATIAELSVTYPGFKGALEEQRKTAEVSMAAAEKQEDKKARIDAMSKANNLLSGGFVADLQGADSRIKTLRKNLVAAAGEGTTPEEIKVYAAAKQQVEKSLRAVEGALKTGAQDATSAKAVLKKIDSDLEFAAETLAQVTKKVGERKKAETKAVADKEASEEAATKAAEEKVAPWTCEYCSHENPHDATDCGNCKAARPAKN